MAGAESDIGVARVGGPTWRDRVEWALSSGLAAAAAREAEEAARRALEAGAFDELRQHFVTAVTPVLEACAESLRAWGINANVHQTLRDTPAGMRRAFDVGLKMEKFDGRGPGSLTITAVEGREALRVVMRVGPGHIGGDYSEHDGLVHAYDLSDDMVGGLVATLVERIFR